MAHIVWKLWRLNLDGVYLLVIVRWSERNPGVCARMDNLL